MEQRSLCMNQSGLLFIIQFLTCVRAYVRMRVCILLLCRTNFHLTFFLFSFLNASELFIGICKEIYILASCNDDP